MTPHEKLAQKGLDLIQQQLGNPSFNVEQLIADLEISRAKCYRVFKEVFNQAPSEVIHELRLQKSSYLLQKKSLNISEISFECGFNDPKYFSKAFKKRYGHNRDNTEIKKKARQIKAGLCHCYALLMQQIYSFPYHRSTINER